MNMHDNHDRIAFFNESDDRRYGKSSKIKYLPKLADLLKTVESHEQATMSPVHVIELGCGRTEFSDIHPGYIGVDLSHYALTKYVPGKGVQSDMHALPFASTSVDLVFSIDALEHVPDPERAVTEIARVLKPNGMLFLVASWNVPRWTSKGLRKRAWGELSWPDRARKFLMHFRRTTLGRFLAVVPPRMLREFNYMIDSRPRLLPYFKLEPDLSAYIESDSDAFSAVDAQSVMLWLKAHGWIIKSHPTLIKRVLARQAAIVAVKPAITI